MRQNMFLVPFIIFCFSCTGNSAQTFNQQASATVKFESNENPYHSIKNIPLPAGYKLISENDPSFAEWLGNVHLKKDRRVFLYNGSLKENQTAQFAVLDISVSKEDLQQCADAVMRLRAEYLYDAEKFNEIIFTDNENGSYKFDPPYTRKNFSSYLTKVFSMCGSASLSKQLHSVSISSIQPGDVLIRGGFPGHAVIVLAVAENAGGRKIYLLAQSYMPAQDIHVLLNPMNELLSPWFEAKENEKIYTQEYIFMANELKRW